MGDGGDFPRDVTRKRLSELDPEVQLQSLKMRSDVLGVGMLESVDLWPGLKLARAAFSGQLAYDAQVQGLAGLIVEVRLKGSSMSREVGGAGRVTRMSEGWMEIAACPTPAVWSVSAPEQPRFHSLSVGMQPEFLRQMSQTDPDLAATCDRLLAARGLSRHRASTRVMWQAQALLDADLTNGAGRLRGMALALDMLSSVLPVEHHRQKQDSELQYALDYIRQNPGLDTTIGDVAQACRLSETALKSRFRETYGQSIGSAMRTTRLNAAREMLDAGSNLKDAAAVLCYSGPDSLSRALKSHGLPELPG